MYRFGDIIVLDFTTHNPFTGDVSDVDTLPICEIFKGIDDNVFYSPIVEKRIDKIGDYKISIDTALNNFEVNEAYNIVITVTVNGITAKAVINSFILNAVSAIRVKINDEIKILKYYGS